MSDISRLTKLLVQCTDIQRVATERDETLHVAHRNNPGDREVEQQIRLTDEIFKEAHFLVGGFEVELCAHIPETPAEILVQVLLVNSIVRSHELTGDSDRSVRLLLQNIIQGLIKLSPEDDAVHRLLPTYFHPECDAWQHRFDAFAKSSVSAKAA